MGGQRGGERMGRSETEIGKFARRETAAFTAGLV